MDAVVFDCDGTLVDVTGLRHFVEGRDSDYDSFHEKASYAPPIPWVLDEVRRWYLSSPMPHVVIVTARQHKYRAVTEQWLTDNHVWYHQLMMRPDGDLRSDYDIKKDALAALTDHGYRVVHAYDDNPDTCRLWIEHGVATTIIPGWGRDD